MVKHNWCANTSAKIYLASRKLFRRIKQFSSKKIIKHSLVATILLILFECIPILATWTNIYPRQYPYQVKSMGIVQSIMTFFSPKIIISKNPIIPFIDSNIFEIAFLLIIGIISIIAEKADELDIDEHNKSSTALFIFDLLLLTELIAVFVPSLAQNSHHSFKTLFLVSNGLIFGIFALVSIILFTYKFIIRRYLINVRDAAEQIKRKAN